MAHKSQDQKLRKIQFQTPKIIKIIIWGVIGFLVVLMIGWQFVLWWRLETAKAAAVALQPQAAIEPIKQPTVVWKKWKEISLTEEWSEYQDTPTQKDRIVPPPGGKVEVIYENGAYFELKDTSSGDKYEAIDVQIRGRFKLKGIRGTKASIWIGRIV